MSSQDHQSESSRVTRRDKPSRLFLPSRILKRQSSSSHPTPLVTEAPPFLRIPSEIRREIFRHLLPNDKKKFRLYTDCDSTVIGTAWNRQNSPPSNQFSLAILRTNRLIYHEALSIIYSENLFHFIAFNYLPVLDFIRRLSPDARGLVRKVRLTLLSEEQGQEPPNHDAFCTTIHDFLPGLTTLHADPWIWF